MFPFLNDMKSSLTCIHGVLNSKLQILQLPKSLQSLPQEFLAMKCSSFERKRSKKMHFDRMSRQFCSINGMDGVKIKRTFLNSLMEPSGDETLCMMNIQQITLHQASLGKIYQHTLIALEKLRN